MPLTNKQRTAIIEIIQYRIRELESNTLLLPLEKRTFKESYQSLIKAIESDISAQEALQELKAKKLKTELERSRNNVVIEDNVVGTSP